MERFRKRGLTLSATLMDICKNVAFIQGDVGKLPFSDKSLDVVLRMNGFHAFPDKKKAFIETRRVLNKKRS